MDNMLSSNESKTPQIVKYGLTVIITLFVVAIAFFVLWLSGYIPYIKIGNSLLQSADGYHMSSTGLVRSVSIAGFVKEVNGNKVIVEDEGSTIEFETYEGTQFSFEQQGEEGQIAQLKSLEQGDIGVGNAIQTGLALRNSKLVADVIIKVLPESGSAPYDK